MTSSILLLIPALMIGLLLFNYLMLNSHHRRMIKIKDVHIAALERNIGYKDSIIEANSREITALREIVRLKEESIQLLADRVPGMTWVQEGKQN